MAALQLQWHVEVGKTPLDMPDAQGVPAIHWGEHALPRTCACTCAYASAANAPATAAFNNHCDIVAFLVKHGANVNARNARQETALNWAAQAHLSMVKVLLDLGADPTLADDKGYTPAHNAAQRGQPLILDFLHGRDVNVHATDTAGRNTLHWAAYLDQPLVIEWLLSHGADAMTPDAEGCLPLHWAALQAHRDVAQQLLDAGSTLEQLQACDRTGMTAAELAAGKAKRMENPAVARAFTSMASALRKRERVYKLWRTVGLQRHVPRHYGFLFWVLALVVMPLGFLVYWLYIMPYTAHRTWVTSLFLASLTAQAYW